MGRRIKHATKTWAYHSEGCGSYSVRAISDTRRGGFEFGGRVGDVPRVLCGESRVGGGQRSLSGRTDARTYGHRGIFWGTP